MKESRKKGILYHINFAAIIIGLMNLFGFVCQEVYSQEKTAQTQPAKTDKTDDKAGKKEVTFDGKLPTIIMYFDPKNESQVKFVEIETVGMGKNVNFGAMDINQPEVQQRLRNLLSRYQRSEKDNWNIVCVIGKDQETTVILGTKDIAKYLTPLFKYYSNSEIFPNKYGDLPELKYKLVETIADKFNDLGATIENIAAKFNEYKALATEANEVLQSTVEGKSDDKTLIILILLIVSSAFTIYLKAKEKITKKERTKEINDAVKLGQSLASIKEEKAGGHDVDEFYPPNEEKTD